MTSAINKIRIIFFIGSLRMGGKERRLIELLTYLKKKDQFHLMLVVTKDSFHYSDFYKLNIPYQIIRREWKKHDPTVFYKFYTICQKFRPHIIHTWGRMQSFYTLPTVIGRKIPLVNGQITAAPPRLKKWSILNLIDRINFCFSKIIISNSKAGIASYNPPLRKARVIYNGLNIGRFENLPNVDDVKLKYGICTPYAVVMVASFTPNKDYNLFYNIAKKVTKLRNDITFIGVGGCDQDDSIYRRFAGMSVENKRIVFPGSINDVEALVNGCDIGILLTNKHVHGEGASNSVLEYMALAKPVIANDAGGTSEIVQNNENGYLIEDHSEDEIVELVTGLINDKEKCLTFGKAGRTRIEESFSLNKMGEAYEKVYNTLLAK